MRLFFARLIRDAYAMGLGSGLAERCRQALMRCHVQPLFALVCRPPADRRGLSCCVYLFIGDERRGGLGCSDALDWSRIVPSTRIIEDHLAAGVMRKQVIGIGGERFSPTYRRAIASGERLRLQHAGSGGTGRGRCSAVAWPASLQQGRADWGGPLGQRSMVLHRRQTAAFSRHFHLCCTYDMPIQLCHGRCGMAEPLISPAA
ncbi:hypothetical protein FHY18_002384 [Xanthomonas arboricola]|uniref:hypothetical protein n=1 Tax=Xanthomonas sp. 3793 TaxID=3035312 RepID=UPI002166D6F0|nr:hypothetical protein [Xanthomonas sp. 3793]MCS3746788.1 hypothetical protein [Xanthomonas sp. 3793]